MVLVRAPSQPRIEWMGSISLGTSFICQGVTHAYELKEAFRAGWYTQNSTGIVLRGFPLLLIEMGLAHFLKYDSLSIWALALNQVHPPTPSITHEKNGVHPF